MPPCASMAMTIKRAKATEVEGNSGDHAELGAHRFDPAGAEARSKGGVNRWQGVTDCQAAYEALVLLGAALLTPPHCT